MILSRRRFALACLLAAGSVPVLAAPEPETPVAKPPAGQLLVATPGMDDPRFARTVILIVQHDITGAFGVTINRPIGDEPVAELLRGMGEDPGQAKGSLAVLAGGPLQVSVGFVVHSTEYHVPETLVLDAHLAVSPPRRTLRDIGAGRGPRKRMLTVGYAGWGPEQLEDELSRRVWVTVQESPELVFDMDRVQVWNAAFARRTISL
jgi:putative transcriptional regulator